MISSVMSSGVAGIQGGLYSLNRSGQDIARTNIPAEKGGPGSIIEPMVNQIQAKNQLQASARVVEVGSEILGTLIDIRV
jgi:hypothetical protein